VTGVVIACVAIANGMNLDQAPKQPSFLVAPHGVPDFVGDEPGGLVGDADEARKLLGADAAWLGQEEQGLEPGGQGRTAAFHDGAGGDGGLSAAAAAFKKRQPARADDEGLGVTAGGTAEAAGPAGAEQQPGTAFLGGKERVQRIGQGLPGAPGTVRLTIPPVVHGRYGGCERPKVGGYRGEFHR